jgi:hypothetical protein
MFKALVTSYQELVKRPVRSAFYRGSDLWSPSMSSVSIILFPVLAQAGQGQKLAATKLYLGPSDAPASSESSKRLLHLGAVILNHGHNHFEFDSVQTALSHFHV